jgi:hypothetical protein
MILGHYLPSQLLWALLHLQPGHPSYNDSETPFILIYSFVSRHKEVHIRLYNL